MTFDQIKSGLIKDALEPRKAARMKIIQESTVEFIPIYNDMIKLKFVYNVPVSHLT